MKTEYLKSLGITDQATIDAIMAENGRDINAAKADLDAQKEKVKALEKTVAEAEDQIKGLEEAKGNAEGLQKELDDLKAEKTKAEEAYKNDLASMKKSHLVENGLRDARAKSVKAVIPFLDMDKITVNENGIEGLTEQIEALSASEKTSFLFATEPSPSGLRPPDPSPSSKSTPATGMSFREAVEAALTKE